MLCLLWVLRGSMSILRTCKNCMGVLGWLNCMGMLGWFKWVGVLGWLELACPTTYNSFLVPHPVLFVPVFLCMHNS